MRGQEVVLVAWNGTRAKCLRGNRAAKRWCERKESCSSERALLGLPTAIMHLKEAVQLIIYYGSAQEL